MNREVEKMESATMSQAKEKISELVSRVATRGDRIVLTSRGRPKAALVSIEDLERLQSSDTVSKGDLQSFFRDIDRASKVKDRIRTERGGIILPDSANLIREMRDERDEQIIGLR
jgi:prevent-host-death family protein